MAADERGKHNPLPAPEEVKGEGPGWSLPRPALPRSLAAELSQEIALRASLAPPPLPHSVAAAVAAEIALSAQLAPPALPGSVAPQTALELSLRAALQPPPLPASGAAAVLHRIGAEAAASAAPGEVGATPPSPPLPSMPPPPCPERARQANLAPTLLVAGLLSGLGLLVLTNTWPHLGAGELIVQTLLQSLAPAAAWGLGLLLLTSLALSLRPSPRLRPLGAAAFALSGALTLPPLYAALTQGPGLVVGDTVIEHRVEGNVIALAGDVTLRPGAEVTGRVVSLLGDITQQEGAQVRGGVEAALGRTERPPGAPDLAAPTPRDEAARPLAFDLATAAAFRPVLGWLRGAAWPQVFVALTGGLLLLLFVAGAAPVLAQRQRQAPIRTLALGVLALAALLVPALLFTLGGLLGAGLLSVILAAVLIATGLSVSLYDAGRALACRAHFPVPDALGALVGLSTFAASLSVPPLAFALALVGGVWGAGTLLLTRRGAGEF